MEPKSNPSNSNEEEEYFDIVNEHDEVIGSALRSVVHDNGYLHRAAHIWVFTPDLKLWIHKRTAHKREEPLKWTSSAAGHVSSGEDYEVSAERELFEELGLRGKLHPVHKLMSGPEVGYEHTVLFAVVCEEQPTPDPREILEMELVDWTEIDSRIAKDPGIFTNPFRLFVRWASQSGWTPEAIPNCQ